jgi:hypothetical protein
MVKRFHLQLWVKVRVLDLKNARNSLMDHDHLENSRHKFSEAIVAL